MRGFYSGFWLMLLLSLISLTLAAQAADVTQLPSISELPDPFLLPNGKRVATKHAWEQHRKALLALVLKYEYGPLPPTGDRVTGAEESESPVAGLDATEKHIRVTMGPDGAVSTHLILTVPAGKGPFPTIVRGDLTWGRVEPAIVAEIVKRGYVLAEFDRNEIASDNAERTGVYAAYPDYHGGRLSAWAWGYQRVVDYLVTQPFVDAHRLVETGHSRGGKATLLAGATDTRIALTVPNNSGCGGAGCYRYQGEKSEDIAAIHKSLGYWFDPHFKEFIGHVDRLPFDQHTVKALIAPRALLTTEGLGDAWGNPSGTQQSYLAAREVYDFLGVPNKIGIHFRPGAHMQGPEDWQALLDFADYQFFGKRPSTDFHALAFSGLPEVFTWKAPPTPERRAAH